MKSDLILIQNFAASLLVKLATPLSSFLVFALVARQLSVEVVGQYTLLASMLMIFQFLSSLGLSPMIVRDIANRQQTPSGIYSHVAAIGLLGLLLWIPLFWGIAWAGGYPQQVVTAAGILALCLPFAFFGMINESLFMGIERFRYIPLVNLADAAFLLTVSALVLAAGQGIVGLALALAGGKVVAAVTGFWIMRRKTNLRLEPIQKQRLQAIARVLPAFFLNFAFGILYYRADIMQLSQLVSEREMGLYAAAYKLFMLAAILPESFFSALYPRIARAALDGSAIEDTLRALRYVFVALTPILLTLLFFGRPILTLLFGAAYAEAAPAQTLLVWLLFPYAATNILSSLFLACDQLWVTAGVTIFAVLAVVGLNFILIQAFGFPGAAASLLVVQTSCVLLLLQQLQRRLAPIAVFFRYLILHLPSLAGAALFFIWPWPGDGIRFSLGMLLAVVLIPTLGIVNRADLDWIRERLSGRGKAANVPTSG